MQQEEKLERLLTYFPRRIADALIKLPDTIEEVRIRQGQLIELYGSGCDMLVACKDGPPTVTNDDCINLMGNICMHSVYAWENELRQGFITLPGGYRVGMAGRTVIEGGVISRIDTPTYFNFRIARECKGAANTIMPHIIDGTGSAISTLIVSPPGHGKTTLLRDVTRQLSYGIGGAGAHRVCVIDERSEIAGCRLGVALNDIGPRTDVLDGCPKAAGMMWAIRVMSPQVLVCDELGQGMDIEAALIASSCGVALIASAHGNDISSVIRRFENAGFKLSFQRYVLLDRRSGIGFVELVCDDNGRILYKGGSV